MTGFVPHRRGAQRCPHKAAVAFLGLAYSDDLILSGNHQRAIAAQDRGFFTDLITPFVAVDGPVPVGEAVGACLIAGASVAVSTAA